MAKTKVTPKPSIEDLSALLMGEVAEAPQSEKKSVTRPTLKGGRLYFGSTKMNFGINLFKATEEEKVSFNQLHDECLTQLKQGKMHCPTCDVDVDKEHTVKGFKTEDGFILVSEDEKKSCQVMSEKRIEIEEFVPATSVDPIYFASTEFVVPEDGTLNAEYFGLLRASMVSKGLVAIATCNLRGKQETIIIRPFGTNGMAAHYMYFEHEVRSCDKWQNTKPDATKLAVMNQLVDALTDDFAPEEKFDSYTVNLKKLIASKKAGVAAPVVLKKADDDAPADLMAALMAAINSPDVASKKEKRASRKKLAVA